jgi:hypothetical protein
MKVYVDSQEEDFICDSFLADNTRLISEFHHEESELEYTECELLDLADHTKQVRKEVCEEIYNKCEPLFRLVNNYDNGDVIERNELVDILDQLQGEDNGN